MTIDDVGEIVDLLIAAYPQFYAKKSDKELDTVMDLWATMFVNEDVRLVKAAVKSFIEADEKGFPPVIGQIKAKIRLITGDHELSEAEAWGMVMDILNADSDDRFRALRAGQDYDEECFYRLPPIIQRVIHSPDQLYDWRSMDRERLSGVVASNFMRSYSDLAAREREYNKLPEDVKHLLSEMGVEHDFLPQRREIFPDWKGGGFYERRKFGSVGSLPAAQDEEGFSEDEE